MKIIYLTLSQRAKLLQCYRNANWIWNIGQLRLQTDAFSALPHLAYSHKSFPSYTLSHPAIILQHLEEKGHRIYLTRVLGAANMFQISSDAQR